MKIIDYLDRDAVEADLKSTSKGKVLEELVQMLVRSGKVKNLNRVVENLREREELGSTGIGQGVAIPHSKCDEVKDLVIAFGRSKEGVNFEALDGEPVYLFFLLLAPRDAASIHLKALARISRLLKNKSFRQALRNANSANEIIDIIREEDEKQ
ncbi:MAG: PTS sugar transporter subunit IIA [bacterium]